MLHSLLQSCLKRHVHCLFSAENGLERFACNRVHYFFHLLFKSLSRQQMGNIQSMGFLCINRNSCQNHPLSYLSSNYTGQYLSSSDPRNQSKSYFWQSKFRLFRAQDNVSQQGQLEAPTKCSSLNNRNDWFRKSLKCMLLGQLPKSCQVNPLMLAPAQNIFYDLLLSNNTLILGSLFNEETALTSQFIMVQDRQLRSLGLFNQIVPTYYCLSMMIFVYDYWFELIAQFKSSNLFIKIQFILYQNLYKDRLNNPLSIGDSLPFKVKYNRWILVCFQSVIQQYCMRNYQNYKITKKPYNSIASLNKQLFSKMSMHGQPPYQPPRTNTLLFNQFQQQTPIHNTVLSRAKQLTYSNKGKIQKIKKEIQRMEQKQAAQFMTGVGLYQPQKDEELLQSYGQFDEHTLMQNLRQDSYDDLAQLRRMIRKTENNLRQYSQSVYNVQNSIVNAADKYGKQIDIDLSLKINRCGLDRTFSKFKPSSKISPATEMVKARTFSSAQGNRSRF